MFAAVVRQEGTRIRPSPPVMVAATELVARGRGRVTLPPDAAGDGAGSSGPAVGAAAAPAGVLV